MFGGFWGAGLACLEVGLERIFRFFWIFWIEAIQSLGFCSVSQNPTIIYRKNLLLSLRHVFAVLPVFGRVVGCFSRLKFSQNTFSKMWVSKLKYRTLIFSAISPNVVSSCLKFLFPRRLWLPVDYKSRQLNQFWHCTNHQFKHTIKFFKSSICQNKHRNISNVDISKPTRSMTFVKTQQIK